MSKLKKLYNDYNPKNHCEQLENGQYEIDPDFAERITIGERGLNIMAAVFVAVGAYCVIGILAGWL